MLKSQQNPDLTSALDTEPSVGNRKFTVWLRAPFLSVSPAKQCFCPRILLLAASHCALLLTPYHLILQGISVQPSACLGLTGSFSAFDVIHLQHTCFGRKAKPSTVKGKRIYLMVRFQFWVAGVGDKYSEHCQSGPEETTYSDQSLCSYYLRKEMKIFARGSGCEVQRREPSTCYQVPVNGCILTWIQEIRSQSCATLPSWTL